MRYWRVRYRREKYINKSPVTSLRLRTASQIIIDEPIVYFKMYYCEITMDDSIDLEKVNLRKLMEEVTPEHEPLQIVDLREISTDEAKDNRLDWIQVYPVSQ